jgi:hypothetical protein
MQSFLELGDMARGDKPVAPELTARSYENALVRITPFLLVLTNMITYIRFKADKSIEISDL